MIGYVCIALTILLTLFSELVLKWRIDQAAALPAAGGGKLAFLRSLLLDAWVIASFAAAALAGLTWMGALSQLDLSRAYPFLAITFLLVVVLSRPLFGEALTRAKVLGVTLIAIGLAMGAQG